VGYVYFNPAMRKSSEAKIGDTYTKVGLQKQVQPLPGFEEPKPMVFVAAFPVDQSDLNISRIASTISCSTIAVSRSKKNHRKH